MPIQVYSFYIFDRHTECVYSKLWVPRPPPQSIASPPSSRPQSQPPPPSISSATTAVPPSITAPSTATAATSTSPGSATTATNNNAAAAAAAAAVSRKKKEDDAKLIFGTVFSLRNMVRKLGGDDDAFISYRTAHYKLHYYETPTNLRFAMLTEPGALSMRNVLHQIYINLWVEYVVKNPLAPAEHKGGEGVRNEMFEMGLDKFIRGLM
ncbi:snare-like protein [Daldinia caldariorum]|uniref:snare-like protein n=1 Tax=Daldinia caldariorum TaxID=326644 RepID=UPI0020087C62|nr:snare-like protein [Daldinia caldariorum]KAI1469570.1 snare-like protein [Daldinia caldariorum]